MEKNNLPRGIRMVKGKYMWDVTYRGIRRTGTSISLDEAIKSRQNMLHLLETRQEKSGTLSFKGLLQKVQKKWVGSRSLRTSMINAREVVSFFGEKTDVASIAYRDIENFKDFLAKKGNSNATINRKLAALSKMLTIALNEDYLLKKPIIEKLCESEGRIRFLSQEEESTILSLLQRWGKTDHCDAVQILLDTGMRTGELWKLKERDIDFTCGSRGSVVLWNTKNDKSRAIPMTCRVKQILKKRIKGNPNRLLFPYNNDWMIRVWNRVKHNMRLDSDKEFVPHCLRHTFASRLVQEDIRLPQVQKLMGHQTLQVTMRYAHLVPLNLMHAIEKLEHYDKAG